MSTHIAKSVNALVKFCDLGKIDLNPRILNAHTHQTVNAYTIQECYAIGSEDVGNIQLVAIILIPYSLFIDKSPAIVLQTATYQERVKFIRKISSRLEAVIWKITSSYNNFCFLQLSEEEDYCAVEEWACI